MQKFVTRADEGITVILWEKESIDSIFKLLRGPGIDAKESIPPASVAWRAGTTTLFLLGS